MYEYMYCYNFWDLGFAVLQGRSIRHDERHVGLRVPKPNFVCADSRLTDLLNFLWSERHTHCTDVLLDVLRAKGSATHGGEGDEKLKRTAGLDEPGMGRMSSPCARSQAMETWPGVALCFSATPLMTSTILRTLGKFSVEKRGR